MGLGEAACLLARVNKRRYASGWGKGISPKKYPLVGGKRVSTLLLHVSPQPCYYTFTPPCVNIYSTTFPPTLCSNEIHRV